MKPSCRPSCFTFLLVVCCALLAPALGRADLLFLKDGFILQGKVRRQSVTYIDPTGDSFPMPKGFMMVDDGVRRVFFSPLQVRIAERMAPPHEEWIGGGKARPVMNPRSVTAILDVLETSDWNSAWSREFYFQGPRGKVGMRQHLGFLSPSWARVDATTKFFYSAAYRTSEFGADTVLSLLQKHPQFQEGPKVKKETIPALRMRIVDFMAQAGWLEHAGKELDRLVKDFPDQKARVAAARKTLERMKLRDRAEQLKLWRQAGRHLAVRKALAAFPVKEAPDQVRVDIARLKSEDDQLVKRLQRVDSLLDACAKEATEPRDKPLVAAVQVIRGELHPSNLDRLDAFVGQANQAEREKAAKRKPTKTPAQIISLAVSGWLLGSSSAEARPDAAQALWKTRTLILEYLKTDNAEKQAKLLEDYLAKVSPRVDLDEIAQLIPNLPPEQPAVTLSTEPVQRKITKGRKEISYHIQLPPEYTHNRPYPVLFVLHREGESATDMLQRWETLAADNGYILVAPQWEQNVGGGYGFTEAEHDTVLLALRDLRRRYRIDSDRVFLFGLGEGGRMAFDVGLAHPSLFAGIAPMAAGPARYPARTWRNAQYLPIYAVNGGKAGDSHEQLRLMFSNWIQRGFPALWIEYKGRGQEWFSAEAPTIMDWMRKQKRAFPLRQLGSDGLGGPNGNEFMTLRQENNRFYWLSLNDVNGRFTVGSRWNNNVTPAAIMARVDPDLNDIQVRASGINHVTLWIGRNSQGVYMVDLDKPVSVRAGFRLLVNKRKISPSLSVLLDDLYQRGDRQQLFVAKIDLKLN
jgi:predicted esterase